MSSATDLVVYAKSSSNALSRRQALALLGNDHSTSSVWLTLCITETHGPDAEVAETDA